ncbi:MAG: hypothetical protein SF029_25715 [bacterium]|nr:hypothetical protein [bacterium]
MTTTSWPSSIREINNLPDLEKQRIYQTLIPDWLYDRYGIDRRTLKTAIDPHPSIIFRCPAGSRALELIAKRRSTDLDPVLYLNMADTFNHHLLVLLVIVNDPDAPRFNIDVDLEGNRTQFGTSSRNIVAEQEAMRFGLAPGQIRRGMRAFKESVPIFERFVRHMGHDLFFIEPLSYHNAIVFERYGFSYLRGLKDMEEINREFQPGGDLYHRLTAENPFRHPDAWRTIRGRSWAIHDGILGHPFTGFQMYKRIGVHAGVSTFPNAQW